MVNSTVCPIDGSAKCKQPNGKEVTAQINNCSMSSFAIVVRHTKQIPVYVDSHRDCSNARGSTCSKDEPCAPCQLSSLQVRKSSHHWTDRFIHCISFSMHRDVEIVCQQEMWAFFCLFARILLEICPNNRKHVISCLEKDHIASWSQIHGNETHMFLFVCFYWLFRVNTKVLSQHVLNAARSGVCCSIQMATACSDLVLVFF
mgnify:CR=1 FL=1